MSTFFSKLLTLFQYKIARMGYLHCVLHIGVARIFDWGGEANYKSQAMTSSETLKAEFFVGAKIS